MIAIAGCWLLVAGCWLLVAVHYAGRNNNKTIKEYFIVVSGGWSPLREGIIPAASG
jgi:hypothetical protein